jgi:hypothetical protein
MNEIRYVHVDIPALIAERTRQSPPYVPRRSDVVEYEVDDHVAQITLPNELDGQK